MAEGKSFWTTLPGILTGTAGLIASIAALLQIPPIRDAFWPPKQPGVISADAERGKKSPSSGSEVPPSSRASPATEPQRTSSRTPEPPRTPDESRTTGLPTSEAPSAGSLTGAAVESPHRAKKKLQSTAAPKQPSLDDRRFQLTQIAKLTFRLFDDFEQTRDGRGLAILRTTDGRAVGQIEVSAVRGLVRTVRFLFRMRTDFSNTNSEESGTLEFDAVAGDKLTDPTAVPVGPWLFSVPGDYCPIVGDGENSRFDLDRVRAIVEVEVFDPH